MMITEKMTPEYKQGFDFIWNVDFSPKWPSLSPDLHFGETYILSKFREYRVKTVTSCQIRDDGRRKTDDDRRRTIIIAHPE